ncbi:AVAST type 3 anti-phage proein Avs3b [Desulfolutivibrio sulfoxidireducens]|uniref:AVAST type 3 anti-phage proein Avs3b n=1 Tax=Desulfolutivibrio sulfoxidireducens TaxID=2773299 RepID=UPI00159D0BF1|nr:AVAST type 3 anti-phage proein Avs3b [Desulfolutivibrio sulfoxidireducens]QLA16270.1 hypothetical protein GD605_09135 [Desulfolutivibrio sulfoxidireducens]
MKKTKSHQKLESISSMQTENCELSEAIFALGKKLVEELGLDASTDTLGRWMSHYIAELIVKADYASGDEKNTVERNCFDTILALWNHRAGLPLAGQPFERIRELAQVIESLDPDNSLPRYFRVLRSKIAEEEETADVKNWLELADELDYSAKILISSCLGNAAHEAKDKIKEWVGLAEAAGMEVEGEGMMIGFVERVEALEGASDIDKVKLQHAKGHIARLELCSKLAAKYAAALKKKVHAKSEK